MDVTEFEELIDRLEQENRIHRQTDQPCPQYVAQALGQPSAEQQTAMGHNWPGKVRDALVTHRTPLWRS